MPDAPVRRPRAPIVAFLGALVLASLLGPATAAAAAPPKLESFMAALGAVESHGRYEARNASSGAIGKYQILPANWRSWSRRYLGDADAEPTPKNQELVAHAKVVSLYAWLGTWPAVAHWWLTGDPDPDPDHWSDFSRSYVNRVIAAMGDPTLPIRAVGATVQDPPPGNIYDDATDRAVYSVGWNDAGYRSYIGGEAQYAVDAGETVTFTFYGATVEWIGPKGPTRGEANVYVDGELAATVDTYARHFSPTADLYTASFGARGLHSIAIEVVGTAGRPVVAVDGFAVEAGAQPPCPSPARRILVGPCP